MGVTTRAAAQRKAPVAAARTHLLDLPETVLEHILIAASDGGQFNELRSARLACSRLRDAAAAAAREAAVNVGSLEPDERAPPALLPRLGALARLQLSARYEMEDVCIGRVEDDLPLLKDLANSISEHCRSVAGLELRSPHVGPVPTLACAFGFVGVDAPAAAPRPPPALIGLTSLALDWPGTLRGPLAPLARLTRLTALKLRGCAKGADAADWLPPSLEVLHLSARRFPDWDWSRGVGGAGWLAALHAGACPRLRALRLVRLSVRDYNQQQGLTLANTLPRLTALEQLTVTAYESRNLEEYEFGFDDPTEVGSDGSVFSSDGEEDYDADDGGGGGGGGAPAQPWPIPAAPLLGALPNLRHCRAVFVRPDWDRDHGGLQKHCRTTPMLLAAPAELAALRAPKLESLALGLVSAPYAAGRAWRCEDFGDEDDDLEQALALAAALAGAPAGGGADAPAGEAAGAAPAGSGGAVGGGLAALRSLELHVACNRAAVEGASLYNLSAIVPNSLPALRRLQVLPLSFECSATQLPLDALARAAPSLERLVIDPRSAGPLDALFCDGGCALNLRSLMVLPAPRYDAGAPARLDTELRSGLRARAAACRREGFRSQAPRVKVTVFGERKWSAGLPDPYPRRSAVAWRPFCPEDGRYVGHFLQTGPARRRLLLASGVCEDPYGVEAYERKHA